MLIALKEVEDQLAALRLLADQHQAQSQAVTASSHATALAHSRYHSGLASQLEFLDAQRNELRSRGQALQVHAQRYQATVGLIRALGGGWGDPPRAALPAPATARAPGNNAPVEYRQSSVVLGDEGQHTSSPTQAPASRPPRFVAFNPLTLKIYYLKQ